MNDTNSQAPTTPATGFVLPTTNAEGQSLDAKGQFEAMSKNAAWSRDALIEGTQAREQFNDLNRRMAEAVDDPAALAEPPAQSGSEYHFQGLDPMESPEAAQFDAAARSWLQEAGFDGNTGTSLAARADELSRKAANWGETEIAQLRQASIATLRKIHGDTLEAKLDLVDNMIDAIEAKIPGLAEVLDLNPFLLADSQILHQLIVAAEARAAGQTPR
jgi:hypothetical protein